MLTAVNRRANIIDSSDYNLIQYMVIYCTITLQLIRQ